MPLAAALLLCLQSPYALAQEPLLARIMEVDRDNEVLVLQVLDAHPGRQITLPLGEGGASRDIRAGALVRLWPGPGDNQQSRLNGSRFTPLGNDRFNNDRTGVRGRLRRGSGPGLGGGGGRGGR